MLGDLASILSSIDKEQGSMCLWSQHWEGGGRIRSSIFSLAGQLVQGRPGLHKTLLLLCCCCCFKDSRESSCGEMTSGDRVQKEWLEDPHCRKKGTRGKQRKSTGEAEKGLCPERAYRSGSYRKILHWHACRTPWMSKEDVPGSFCCRTNTHD